MEGERAWTKAGGLGWAIAAASLVAACSAATQPYPSADAFCAAKAHEECQVVDRCAVRAEACADQRKQLCSEDAAQALQANREYIPGFAPPCIDALHHLYGSSEPITPAAMARAASLCARVFSGDGAEGAACRGDFDCADPSLVCDKGICGARVERAVGDFCGNPGEVCDDAAFCAGAPLRCVAKKRQAEACDAASPCGAGLRCDGGACAPAFPARHPCATNADCDASAPFCDPFTEAGAPMCDAGMIFAPTSTKLCAQFGG